MTLKRTMAFGASVLLALAAGACTTDLTGTSASDIVIGADLELSGAYADVGATYQRALQLKVEQINATGGVHGHKIQLDVRDNQSDPTVSVSNVSAFLNDPGLTAIVMGWCGECLLAVQKTVQDKRIPTVSLSPATEVAKPVTERRYIFKVGPNVDDDAAVLANEVQGDKIGTVALLGTSDAGGSDALDALKSALTKVGVTVAGTRKFQATDTNLSQPVRETLANKPDALIVSAFSTRALAAATAANAAGFTGRIYFDQAAAGDLFLTGAAMHGTDGIRMVATQSLVIDGVITTNPANVARRQWFNDYTSRYGNFSEYSTYAADAIQLIAGAVSSTGGTGGHDAVRDAAEASQFEGLTSQIRMSPENHSGLVPQALTLLVARGDRWQPA